MLVEAIEGYHKSLRSTDAQGRSRHAKSYAQALNLENYLYLAVASFGLTTVATYAGVFMMLAGVAIVITGVFMYRTHSKAE